MKSDARITLKGISPRLVREIPPGRSGIETLANILGNKRFTPCMLDSDADALRNDWRAVGNDMGTVLRKLIRR